MVSILQLSRICLLSSIEIGLELTLLIRYLSLDQICLPDCRGGQCRDVN
jgi:hypothetical protein